MIMGHLAFLGRQIALENPNGDSEGTQPGVFRQMTPELLELQNRLTRRHGGFRLVLLLPRFDASIVLVLEEPVGAMQLRPAVQKAPL
jgi:hypothetical protein